MTEEKAKRAATIGEGEGVHGALEAMQDRVYGAVAGYLVAMDTAWARLEREIPALFSLLGGLRCDDLQFVRGFREREKFDWKNYVLLCHAVQRENGARVYVLAPTLFGYEALKNAKGELIARAFVYYAVFGKHGESRWMLYEMVWGEIGRVENGRYVLEDDLLDEFILSWYETARDAAQVSNEHFMRLEAGLMRCPLMGGWRCLGPLCPLWREGKGGKRCALTAAVVLGHTTTNANTKGGRRDE